MDYTCPICGSDKNKITIHEQKGLYRCRLCKVIYNSHYSAAAYSDSYFLDDYKNQYGRTYIEDFDNIYNSSNKRIKFILDKIPGLLPENLNLLDIGSALGFFLKAAFDLNIKNVTGVEISSFAAGYCKREFKIPVINTPFQDVQFNNSYNIITAWYFIEHCLNPIAVIKKIYDILEDKGIFAFSVPSCFGPLFLFNRSEWIKSHPADHSIDFSPSSIKKLLKILGFKKILLKTGGIHPERVFSRDSVFFNSFSKIYSIVSKIVTFSDTIEVYAIK